MKNKQENPTINDLEEELSLEDFEDIEDDDDLESVNPDDLEFLIFPTYKENMTPIKDKNNPKKIMKKEKLYLYNPENISSAFVPISGKNITFENLSKRFIVEKANGNYVQKGNKSYSVQMSNFHHLLKTFTDSVNKKIEEDNKNNNTYKPKNKNKKVKKGSY